MHVPRLLVVEGNTAETRSLQRASGARTNSDTYAQVLRRICAANVEIVCPADDNVLLPDPSIVASFDGVVLTGSALHVYDGGPAIDRQIELMRRVFESGTPFFASCWGLQIATVAAGGAVRRNPRGREVGIAEPIRRTAAGQTHPLLAGKPDPYQALTVHLDEVECPAPGTTVLAGNSWTNVQAAEIRHGDGIGWAVQYHPEYSFRDIAAVTRRFGADLIAQGSFKDIEAVTHQAELLQQCESAATNPFAAKSLGINDSVLDESIRTSELRNWFEHLVLPRVGVRSQWLMHETSSLA